MTLLCSSQKVSHCFVYDEKCKGSLVVWLCDALVSCIYIVENFLSCLSDILLTYPSTGMQLNLPSRLNLPKKRRFKQQLESLFVVFVVGRIVD